VNELTEDRVALMIEGAVADALAKHETRMVSHFDVKFGQLNKLIGDAFPGGDPHYHRMFHERMIRDADGWAKLKHELIGKFLTGGLWVAAGWLALAVWRTFVDQVRG